MGKKERIIKNEKCTMFNTKWPSIRFVFHFTFFILLFLFSILNSSAQRSEQILSDGWRFHKGDAAPAAWQNVTIPHDWAITGPFDRSHDLQNVTVTQNGEKVPSWKTGRSGGLPYIGVGHYECSFDVEPGRKAILLFDGAMSEAKVLVNGKEAIFWPYGYSSFYVDVTPYIYKDGKPNTLHVRLENREQSSRWYPGAGLYRKVRLIQTAPTHIAVWGQHVTTPFVSDSEAQVDVTTTVEGPITWWNTKDKKSPRMSLLTEILSPQGQVVSTRRTLLYDSLPAKQSLLVPQPQRWSPRSPALYTARTTLLRGDSAIDQSLQRFGIRTIEWAAERGFYLNGERIKFQGVCLHHDLGPLGAAINRSALRHQLEMLQDMGCNAIRTSHNMPAPELVELCDSMGLMMMLEPFDEWDQAKCRNGYHRWFKEWAERDMVNMLHQYRNNASVVMWSIGNEVPSQWNEQGKGVARWLQSICHREDPSRPVTCGMDQVRTVLNNGFAAQLDIPGFNYRTQYYHQAHQQLPQGIVLGSETASTVSSRGTYMFPKEGKPLMPVRGVIHPNHQSSGYDLEACSWSNVPDEDFALAEDNDWEIGQFVWTGFDYLGEPSPYDTDAWPSHSSLFGIIDLASLPKDRYYLYRSHWAPEKSTLHILPHWTWPGREGKATPVFVYTNQPEAELFVNGKSMGRRRKLDRQEAEALKGKDPLWLQRRYRLMWTDVTYEPGEIRVVAYNKEGKAVDERTVRTAGKPHRLQLSCSPKPLQADGNDLKYITVSIVDKDGNLCPADSSMVQFKVKGNGTFRAAANGDATNLDLFHLPRHHAFAGQLTAIVQAGRQPGTITLRATAKGLKPAEISIAVGAPKTSD